MYQLLTIKKHKMKNTLSKIINLSQTSFLGGYLQFGINYNPNAMWSGSQSYSRFAIAIGFFTFEIYANSKSINQNTFRLNGTSHEVSINFNDKDISHSYKKLEGGNLDYKTSYAYSWK